MKTYTIPMVFTVLLLSQTGHACEWHTGGGFGVFSNLPAPLQYKETNENDQPLKLTHSKRTTVIAGDESVVTLKYSAPLRYRNISIEFIPSQAIEILSETKASPTQIRGDIDVLFSASVSGEHRITVNIFAKENGKPFFTQQSIVVNAN